MALTLTQLNTATDVWWNKTGKTQDIYFQGSPMLWALFGKGKFQEGLVEPGEMVNGGTAIREFVEYNESHGGGWGPLSSVNKSATDIITNVDFQRGGAYAAATIGLTEKLANTGDAARIKLALKKLENCRKTVQRKLAILAYLSRTNAVNYASVNWPGENLDESSFLDGLQSLFGYNNTAGVWPHTAMANTVAFGGLAEVNAASWRNNFRNDQGIGLAAGINYTEVEFNNSFLQAMRDQASPSALPEDSPDYAFCDSVLCNSLSNQMMSILRLTPPSSDYMARVGFRSVIWEGIPIVFDPFIKIALTATLPASYPMTAANAVKSFFMTNSRYLKLRTCADYAFTKPVWEQEMQSGGNNEVANIRWIGAMTCTHRATQTYHNNVIPAK